MKLMENLCRYILHTGCPKFAVGSLGAGATIYLNFHNHDNIQGILFILQLLLQVYEPKNRFPVFSNLDYLHIIFICSYKT